MKTIGTSCLLLPAIALAAGGALAQTPPAAPPASAGGMEVFSLGEIIVTGPPLDAEPAAIDVLPQSLMQALERRRVGEALQTLPGISLSPGNRGGSRNETGLFIRGFDLARTLVLQDGVPIYVPYDGYVDLNRLLTFDLSTIEVSKGFGSVLYGPNSLGNVINLVTQQPTGPIAGNAVVGADFDRDGRYSGARFDANVGGRSGDWYVQVGLSWLDQDFVTLPSSFPGGIFQPQGKRLQSDAEDKRVTAKVGYVPNASDEYAIGVIVQRGEKGAPPYAGNDPTKGIFFNWPYYDRDTAYLTTQTRMNETTVVKGRLYADHFQNSLNRYDDAKYTTQFRPYAFSSEYDDYTYGGSLTFDLTLSPTNQLGVALFAKYDEHREFGPTTPQSRMEDLTLSLAVEDRWTFAPSWALVAGAAYNYRDAIEAQDPGTGGKTSFNAPNQDGIDAQIGLNYSANASNRFFGGISRKTRFASMFERYSYRLGFGLPNPDLAPEVAINYQLGYEGMPWRATNLNAAVFFSDVQDYIQNVVVGKRPTAPFNDIVQPQNVGRAHFYGFELGIKTTALPDIELGANYTYTRTTSESTPPVPLYGIPENKAYAYGIFTLPAGFAFVPSVLYESGRTTTDTGNGNPIPGYTVVNMKLTYAATANVSLEAGVNNVGDKLYYYDDGYPAAGRNYYVNLRGKF